jgi:DnaK suppressor protein
VLESVDSAVDASRERSMDQGRDSIDQSNSESMLTSHLKLRKREQLLLAQIDAALERVADGSADECDDCGEAISWRRLLARPMTRLCVDCQQEQEDEQRRHVSSFAQPE